MRLRARRPAGAGNPDPYYQSVPTIKWQAPSSAIDTDTSTYAYATYTTGTVQDIATAVSMPTSYLVPNRNTWAFYGLRIKYDYSANDTETLLEFFVQSTANPGVSLWSPTVGVVLAPTEVSLVAPPGLLKNPNAGDAFPEIRLTLRVSPNTPPVDTTVRVYDVHFLYRGRGEVSGPEFG